MLNLSSKYILNDFDFDSARANGYEQIRMQKDIEKALNILYNMYINTAE